MTNLFISYRRDDSGGHAGRLSDRLIARFGADRIFLDVDDIQPGQNFQQAIEQTLARCDHMLVVIGPRWLQTIQARQSQGEDFVRHEINVAMSRGMTVIPVLVGGAKMPASDDLPADIAAFARRQAIEIEDDRFDDDAGRLIAFLAGDTRSRAVNVFGWLMPHRALIAGLAVAVVVTAGGWWWARSTPTAVQPPPPVTSAAVDGEWIAEMQKPGQAPYTIRLTLSHSGDQISGAVSYPTGNAPILEGRYDNGRVTFHTSHVPQFESQPATIRFQANVDGATIRLTTVDAAGVATGVARPVGAAGDIGSGLARPSLSYGTWTLRNARDEAGKDWSNSVLQLTAQEDAPDGLSLRGRFTWRLDNALIGTEEVSGRYVARTRLVVLEGSTVEDARPRQPIRLAVGSYSAVLSPDERSLIHGRWGSTAQNEPGFAGEWEAVR